MTPLLLILVVPLAYADITVSVPAGTSVPGCEERNACYLPYEVKIRPGDEVTWHNDDTAAHTVTSGYASDGPNGIFDSSLFMAGSTFSVKFDEKGTFPYFCMVHPWMEGVVIVGDGTPTRPPVDDKPPKDDSSEIRELKQQITDLKMENRNLKMQITSLEAEINSLKDQIVAMSGEFVEAIKQLNEWFREQLGK